MTTTDPRAWLAEAQERASRATDGPWAAWLDQDGQPHMNHMLMVGNADAVIPEGESWVENVDVNPVAHTYTPEDREFIAHARTDLPAMAAALTAVLDLHSADEDGDCAECICRAQGRGDQSYPCPTVLKIQDALDGDRG